MAWGSCRSRGYSVRAPVVVAGFGEVVMED